MEKHRCNDLASSEHVTRPCTCSLLLITMRKKATLHANKFLNVRHRPDEIYDPSFRSWLSHGALNQAGELIEFPSGVHSHPAQPSDFSLTFQQVLYKGSATANFRNVSFCRSSSNPDAQSMPPIRRKETAVMIRTGLCHFACLVNN